MLRHFINFDTDRETLDGRGWHYVYSDDASVPLVSTEDWFYRLQRPAGGTVPSADFTVTKKAITSEIATITTAADHGLVVGDAVVVTLSPADAKFDGGHVILTVPTTKKITFSTPDQIDLTEVTVGGIIRGQLAVQDRLLAVASADTYTNAYFLTRAQGSVLDVHAGEVTSTKDDFMDGEGLTP